MILRRYITNQVATTTVLVLGFLVVMLLGGRLIRYFGMAAEGGLDVSVLFTLIGYNLPYFLELILPLSFFIGLMLVFGRLYSDHEMAAINGSGVSRGRLSRLLMPLVIVLILFEAWVTLVAKPWGVERATNIWKEQSAAQIFDLIRPREFISSGDYHLYVGDVGANREYLSDVIVVQMNSREKLTGAPSTDVNLPSAAQHNEVAGVDLTGVPEQYIARQDALIIAKSATQVDSSDGTIQLDLHQGRRYEIDPASRKYSQIGFERYRITLAEEPQADNANMRIEGVTTPALITAILGGEADGAVRENRNEAKAELGYRLSLPWLMLIAVMLATPLAQVRPRQGRWLKLIPAIFIFVANVLVLISLKGSITKGKLSPYIYPVAVLVSLAFALYLNYHERILARMRLSRAVKVADGGEA